MMDQFICTQQQHGKFDRTQFVHCAIQMRRNLRGQLLVLGDRPFQQLSEEFRVVAPQALFGQRALRDQRRALAGKTPFVNALHGQFARAMAQTFGRIVLLVVAHARAFSRCTISIATRAASAPFTLTRSSACSSVSVVRMALATGTPLCNCTSPTPRADSLETTSK